MRLQLWEQNIHIFMKKQHHNPNLPLYYPFCGADIASAITYFPNASKYILTSELKLGNPCYNCSTSYGQWYEKHWSHHNYAWTETARMKPAFSKHGVLPVIQHMLNFLNISHVVENISNTTCSIRIIKTNQTVEYIQSINIRGLGIYHNLFLKAAPYYYIRNDKHFSRKSKYILQDETGVFPPKLEKKCNMTYFGSWDNLMSSYKCAAIRNFFTVDEKDFYNKTFTPNNPSLPVHFGYSDGCGRNKIRGVMTTAYCNV